MVLCGHLVALVPVRLPLAENGEAGLDVEGDVVGLTLGVTCADVADVVVVVEAGDVDWEGRTEAVDGVLAVAGIDVGHVVHPGELPVDTGGLVEEIVVLVDGD